nr:MAG TPA: hypothetical protein [Caudoviricetes sp.]
MFCILNLITFIINLIKHYTFFINKVKYRFTIISLLC